MSPFRNEIVRWGVRVSAATIAVLGTMGIAETLASPADARSLGMEANWEGKTWYPGSHTAADTGVTPSPDYLHAMRNESLVEMGIAATVTTVASTVLYATRKPWN